jgi:hypothetical protein
MSFATFSFYKFLTFTLVLIVCIDIIKYVVFMALASGSGKFYPFYSRFVHRTRGEITNFYKHLNVRGFPPLGCIFATLSSLILQNTLAGWILHPASKHQDRSWVSLRLEYQPVITTLNCWEKGEPTQISILNSFCDLYSNPFTKISFLK